MPGIWNINSIYNTNTRKVSSKLTFESGERFTGRIVSKGEGKEVTIRLADGWQFNAELDENVDLNDSKLVKFQVDGFEGGKLKLKIVKNNVEETTVQDENFQEVVEKEGLSKDDIDVLKKMVKHDIPLTRENIKEISGLIKFNEKISYNPKEIEAFIEKYLQSKAIPSNSTDGQAVKELLNKFFEQFKKLSAEDILTFIENNLDFSEENINSFNNLFKGDSSIERILAKISDSVKQLDIPKDEIQNNAYTRNVEQLVNNKGETSKNIVDTLNSALASKIYNKNDLSNSKINVLDVLKTINGNSENNLEKIPENKISESLLSKSLIEKLNDKEVVKLIKDIIGDGLSAKEEMKTQATSLIESTNKAKVEDILSKAEGKEVKLTNNEFKQIKDVLSKIEPNEMFKENTTNDKSNVQTQTAINSEKNTQIFKETLEKSQLNDLFRNDSNTNKELIKSEIKGKIEEVRDIVKTLLSKADIKEAGYEKVMDIIKPHINDIKVFNSVSDDYYYLNFPVKAQNTEYPCKLIIKDNRKDGKKIDSTNAKMVVSVKTIKLGEVDGYLTMRENRIDVNLKCDKEFTYTINNNKSKLVDGLSTMGLNVNVSVASKEEPIDIVNCRNFFNDITISAIDTKV